MRPNLINRLKEEWNNLDPVDPLRGLLSDAIDALADRPAQQALDKMAENARELGLDYGPAQEKDQSVMYTYPSKPEPIPCGKPMGILMKQKSDEHMKLYPLAEQPAQQQEPVACVQDLDEVKRKHLVYEKGMDWKDPLYTSPPAQRTWVGLTSDEIAALKTLHGANRERTAIEMAFAVQTKLKEKNT